jgi:hypothetical protein
MRIRMLVALLLLLCSSFACARDTAPGDACPALRSQLASPDPATRIAAIACNEHLLWFRPFIDPDGRLASFTVHEAEASHLADGASEPWRRVAGYWRESGLLWQMNRFPGAGECAHAGSGGYPSPACRAFVVDKPWSAAFVSYVLKRADLPGFHASASHYDYVAAAYGNPAESPFQYLDPATARPGAGDLLCYVRHNGQIFGYAGFVAALGAGNGPYNMHCDIVVAANPGNDGRSYLVGGNVQQGVTMRMLPLNRNGNFWSLPRRTGAEGGCSPDNAAACNFNRQDWVVLLKLKPPAALARLPRTTPALPAAMPVPGSQQCCTACVVGSGVPHCPKPLIR